MLLASSNVRLGYCKRGYIKNVFLPGLSKVIGEENSPTPAPFTDAISTEYSAAADLSSVSVASVVEP